MNARSGARRGVGAPACIMPPIRVLNVAEKPSVARRCRACCAGDASPSPAAAPRRTTSTGVPYEVEGKQCQMVFTSVTGHLMEMEFEGSHKSWRGCNPRGSS